MSESLIYRWAPGYELLMRVLYGRHYEERMRLVADQVPPGSSVLELCCGPGTLYTRYLRQRASAYVGLDVNERFVNRLRRHGIDARAQDLANDDRPLPGADVALIQASLYHFLPHADRIIDRMLEAAANTVVVSEPVRNLATSDSALIKMVGRRAADPGTGGHEQRFDERSLDELMQAYAGRVKSSFLIPGGREKVYVLAAGG